MSELDERLARLTPNPDDLEAVHGELVAALTSPQGLPRRHRIVARRVFARLGSIGRAEQLWELDETSPLEGQPDLLLGLARGRDPAMRATLIERQFAWARGLEADAAANPIDPPQRPSGDRIRLGLFSPDLRRHVVGLFTLPIFRHLDPRFDLYCYSAWGGPTDDVRDYMASRSTWRSLNGMEIRQAAQTIADDGLDMLFELSGFTSGRSPEVLAYKPAPVIASWLGCPYSLGLTAIDRMVVDPFVSPRPDTMPEQPLALPRSWICYFRGLFAVDDPIEAETPEARTGALTFGTMNDPSKYNLETLRLWARIVAATPGSRFLFVRPECAAPTFRRNMTAAFALEGVGADRLAFDPRAGDHLPGYNAIDIALDTFPVTGGTTTCDTLWMGVPVVTLAGDHFFERVSLSALANVGLTDLVADTPEAYMGKAVALAGDASRRRELRHTLRARMRSGPLADPARFAADFYGAVAEAL